MGVGQWGVYKFFLDRCWRIWVFHGSTLKVCRFWFTSAFENLGYLLVGVRDLWVLAWIASGGFIVGVVSGEWSRSHREEKIFQHWTSFSQVKLGIRDVREKVLAIEIFKKIFWAFLLRGGFDWLDLVLD